MDSATGLRGPDRDSDPASVCPVWMVHHTPRKAIKHRSAIYVPPGPTHLAANRFTSIMALGEGHPSLLRVLLLLR